LIQKTNEETVETEAERESKVDGKTVMTEKVKKEVMYTYAQVEEIKAEYEAKLQAKDEEISFIKENAQKVIEIRAELGEFVAKLSDEELFDEKAIKIARLEKENADLKKASISEEAEEIEEAEENVELKASEESDDEDIVEEEASEQEKSDTLRSVLKKRMRIK
jgi:hypothetical protein